MSRLSIDVNMILTHMATMCEHDLERLRKQLQVRGPQRNPACYTCQDIEKHEQQRMMGANEYTPDTEQVREQYTREQPPHIGTVSQKRSELDRWLEQIKREAKAEALEDAATELTHPMYGIIVCDEYCANRSCPDCIRIRAAKDAEHWLNQRARKVREGL